MEKRIELEKRGRPTAEIVDLNLDNTRATQIEGLTEEFVKLEVLSLINVGLTTLKGFPALPSLRKLELSDNRISGGLNLLHGCPKLTHINLSGNKIKDIDTLAPLKQLGELRNLDLFNCEVTSLDKYRESTFELLNQLVYLDGFDRKNEECEDDEDESSEGGEDDDDDEDLEGEEGKEGLDESGAHLDDEDDDDDDDDIDDDDDEDEEEDSEDDDEEGDDENDTSAEVGVQRGLKRKHEEEEEEDEEDEADGDD